jgi:uncharacterized membrane protein
MALRIGIALAIGAMLCWGIYDFLLAIAIRKSSVFKAFFWNLIIASILLLFALPLADNIQSPPAWVWLLILIDSLIIVFSYLIFCKALEIGPVSIVAPVSSLWGGLTLILGIIFLNEVPSKLSIAGLALAIIGLVLVSFKWQDITKIHVHLASKGLKYALIVVAAWAPFYIILDVIMQQINGLISIIVVNAFAAILIVAYKLIKNEKTNIRSAAVPVIAITAVIYALAELFYIFSLNTEMTTLSAPISSLYPAITVMLAWKFLNEKIQASQAVGIALIIIGISALAV